MTSVIEVGNLAKHHTTGEAGEVLRIDGSTATLRTTNGRVVERPVSRLVTITDASQYRHVGSQLIISG